MFYILFILNSKQFLFLLRSVCQKLQYCGDLSLSKGLRDCTEAFEMHPVSAPSLSVHSEEAGNDGSLIPVPEEPQNHT